MAFEGILAGPLHGGGIVPSDCLEQLDSGPCNESLEIRGFRVISVAAFNDHADRIRLMTWQRSEMTSLMR